MKILLTGSNGYIGRRLLPALLEAGHEVLCCVRDKKRFWLEDYPSNKVQVVEIDFLNMPDFQELPNEFDAAYYLIHSMTSSIKDFESMESQTAENFKKYVEFAGVKQVIYLSGIVKSDLLSRHLSSRKRVEEILKSGNYQHTILRAGIIVGSGSASFEIIRDLVEKLPVMIAPKWILTKSQPIAIRDVISYLIGVLSHRECMDQSFDISGPEVLSYKDMLLQFAQVRGLKRYIFSVPVLTPRLSSYWLYFVTSTSYYLAVNLVNSMKIDMTTDDDALEKILQIHPITYKDAIRKSFEKIAQNLVLSSWKDAMVSSRPDDDIYQFINIPKYGCFKDIQQVSFQGDVDKVMRNIWSIGGNTGWYYASWLWKIRGVLDKLVGGVGLRRGRTNPTEIHAGDALDFWRVLLADQKQRRLLLFAEMKTPGEAWLEFRISKNKGQYTLHQIATFRPKGIWGRLYWYASYPFHLFIFSGMAKNIVER